ncbi:hypothetical protein WJX81_000298 [Elliptochloris bilobata]|uniref:Inositol oxygenase n=1 Tax=Elliptochloris bilobata TaxID=381761 RepID=A0AAW1RDU0_9CHLO
MLRRCSSSGDLNTPLESELSSGVCSLTASPALHCKTARAGAALFAARSALAHANAMELLRSSSDFADRHGMHPKALSAARAMAVEAQQQASAAGSSGRSSLEGSAYNTSMDGSMLSEGSHFDADGRCYSPGAIPGHGGAGLNASSLRSMCTDLHDMGTLLGAPSDSHAGDSDEDSEGELPESGAVIATSAGGGFMSERQAAVELFFRLNHARQTVDFVKRQAALSVPLRRAKLGVWEALNLLGTLREYETALLEEEGLDPTLALPEHAAATAEACRAAFPDLDWLHLVGLLHSLGKLLAHKRFGGEPQWAVCGESFPVGCRFSPEVVCAQFFSVNPDRRRRLYSSATGMYRPGCGLAGIYMSWSAAEYLYMVLLLNRTRLPPEALFILRHQKFAAAERGAYDELMSPSDRALLPWLPRFRELSRYKSRPAPPGGHLSDPAFQEYYGGLIAKYIPGGLLRF